MDHSSRLEGKASLMVGLVDGAEGDDFQQKVIAPHFRTLNVRL